MLEIFSGLIPLLEESQGDDRVTRHTLYHLAWMHLLYFHFFQNFGDILGLIPP